MRLAHPALGQLAGVCDVEVDGELLDVVAAREEQDPPVVLPALEHRRVQLLLLELRHALDRPAELALQGGVGVGVGGVGRVRLVLDCDYGAEAVCMGEGEEGCALQGGARAGARGSARGGSCRAPSMSSALFTTGEGGCGPYSGVCITSACSGDIATICARLRLCGAAAIAHQSRHPR